MEREVHMFDRKEQTPEMRIVRLTDALGYGEGPISTTERTEVSPEIITAAEAVIESDRILVPVDCGKDGNTLDDDGCGDGRGVGKIWEGSEERHKSLNRPKVFGGAVAMAASARIGLGQAHGVSIKQTFF